MFNTTHIHKTEHVPYTKEVNVHEHRAPTDKSVELLNEMQKAAIDNIIKTINIQDNTINAVVVYLINRADFNGLNYIVKFSFNGKEHKLEGHILRRELSDTNRFGSDAVSFALARSICLLIAQNILNEAPGLREAINNIWI